MILEIVMRSQCLPNNASAYLDVASGGERGVAVKLGICDVASLYGTG